LGDEFGETNSKALENRLILPNLQVGGSGLHRCFENRFNGFSEDWANAEGKQETVETVYGSCKAH
jgi:hypothetical protein